jgi:hypothetical protein
MDTDERLISYCTRKPVALIVISRDSKRLTPKQRKRLKHKENSRKTHSHAGLPEYHVPDSGYTRHVPCEKCQLKSAKRMIRIGGGEFKLGGNG